MRHITSDGDVEATKGADPTDKGASPSRRRGPDPELKRQLIHAAQQMVTETGGLRVSLDPLNLDDVCRRAGVSRSSAYRIWASRDAFYQDVLRELAGPSWAGTAAFDQETIELAGSIVAANLDKLSTEAQRRTLLREVVRAAAGRNFEAIKDSTDWRTYVALTATLMTLGQENHQVRDEVQTALSTSESTFIGKMATFYEDMAGVLGVRMKVQGADWSTLAAVGAAVVEGLALRQIISPEVVDTPVIVDEPDGPKEWSVAALGFMAIVETWTELDPAYEPTSALSEYIRRLSMRPMATEDFQSEPARPLGHEGK